MVSLLKEVKQHAQIRSIPEAKPDDKPLKHCKKIKLPCNDHLINFYN